MTKKRLNFVIKKGDSNTFYEQINALNDSIVQEWRELGNQKLKVLPNQE